MFLLFTIKSCCILTKQWLNKLVCLCFWSITSLNNPDCIWMTQYQSCHKRTPPHNIACFELSCTSYMELKSCTIMIFDLKKKRIIQLWSLLWVKLNPLQPKISMHILHTALHTFPMVLTRRILLPIKSFFRRWSFPIILMASMCSLGELRIIHRPAYIWKFL